MWTFREEKKSTFVLNALVWENSGERKENGKFESFSLKGSVWTSWRGKKRFSIGLSKFLWWVWTQVLEFLKELCHFPFQVWWIYRAMAVSLAFCFSRLLCFCFECISFSLIDERIVRKKRNLKFESVALCSIRHRLLSWIFLIFKVWIFIYLFCEASS